MYILIINFRGHDGGTFGPNFRYISHEEVLNWLLEPLHVVEHNDFISKKAVTKVVTEIMDVGIHLSHPHKIIKFTLIVYQEEIVVVEVEAHLVLSVTMHPTLALMVVNTMVIMAPQVVVDLRWSI